MIWKLEDIQADLEVLKGKYDDLLSTHSWAGDDIFKYTDRPKNKDEALSYAYGYKEAHIQHQQTFDLMHYYLGEFERIIEKVKELEKASSVKFGDGTDNAEINNNR
ncbi:TPA: DUF1474 family protein [Staphylococcus pseudintermedius]|uniref:type II toxin-antitoxin system toxin TscT n=1 Tax=Staphylococcus pseudintermedius TaxID=283734 RepID=UPI0019F55E03|nr:DUF1474 family protein [Staphylococcus pseudintermedius]EGQ2833022.1 DUF1474 family protein [Staphylococcus pseudintermedius]EGQ3386015.1 DUF1474 family protein [Staphylococcus pseudintermedius]EHE7496926.1 DUF1474 family protein [Staphylococcus pseudintermedius]EHS7172828.1 DUF1474 family protein [Staphylococcus pseudintermedius]